MSVREPDASYALVPGAFVPLKRATVTVPAQARSVRGGHPVGRLFRSELRLMFGRRRNLAALGMLAAVPVVVAVAVRWSGPAGGGEGPAFLALINGNGLFVALTALAVALPLFLPLAISAIAADTIAGEASLGTLRYLLTVPVSRTRLLLVKFAAVVTYTFVGVTLIAAVGAGIGVLLFGGGPAALLSGAQVGFGSGLARLALVCLYLTACLVALVAVGLFVSTLTEQPIGATIAVVATAVTCEVLDAVPQLAAVHPYLLTHHWTTFGELLRDPINYGPLVSGLLSAAVYTAVFGSAAWARFGSRDVTA
ncbi:ABC transporter permease [Cryptosporangium aurantiacum]|uniref:ABC-2 type transport system permease protein n=1 Tax=Cryptosporangium aurantiacum TaxID=134849 RepID=A0A1M7NBH5_9ACTN|nr:ABC transporter permease [Cryptosporangium aurantiacum]SHN00994.1 ABC-2 type transport system permease protein [Cryptosporangium aurantiacum]